MSDLRDLSSSFSSSWRGYRNYHRDGYEHYDVYEREYQLKEENLNLRLKIENSEKTIDELLYRENELEDKVRLLEAQKENLEARLSYQFTSTKDEGLVNWENRRLKDSNLKSELKLELLTHFINKLQSLTAKKDRIERFTSLENLDLTALREKLRDIEGEIVKVFDYRNEKEAQKGLVMGNSEIINKNLKDLNEENNDLKRRIDSLSMNFEEKKKELENEGREERHNNSSLSGKTRVSHKVESATEDLVKAVNRLTEKVETIDEDLRKVNLARKENERKTPSSVSGAKTPKSKSETGKESAKTSATKKTGKEAKTTKDKK